MKRKKGKEGKGREGKRRMVIEFTLILIVKDNITSKTPPLGLPRMTVLYLGVQAP